MIPLESITTEQRNPASAHIDEVPTLDMVRIMSDADKSVPLAVKRILPAIAQAIDETAERLRRGGRLLYLGAGTSGRLGVLDAAECPPTYGTPPGLVVGRIAGGKEAIFTAQEGAEDSEELGRADLEALAVTEKDVVCGIAASGRTPYVIGALRYAGEVHALRLALVSSENAPIARLADIVLAPITGPEVITGSTRMKAGTAQKLVLNMLSTGTMVKLGKVYGNRMVDVKATNKKLEERALRIVTDIADVSREEATRLLTAADGSAKLAILMGLRGCTAEEGRRLLENSHGRLRDALRI